MTPQPQPLLHCDHECVCWWYYEHQRPGTASPCESTKCHHRFRIEDTPAKSEQEKEKVLDELDEQIAIRENEMNRKGGLEDNIVTASGYYASAGALNWVREVLIKSLLEKVIRQDKEELRKRGEL